MVRNKNEKEGKLFSKRFDLKRLQSVFYVKERKVKGDVQDLANKLTAGIDWPVATLASLDKLYRGILSLVPP